MFIPRIFPYVFIDVARQPQVLGNNPDSVKIEFTDSRKYSIDAFLAAFLFKLIHFSSADHPVFISCLFGI